MRVALAQCARDGRSVAVILADVDAMKDINDSFGHAVGDDVLAGARARSCRGCVGSGDTVARLGGDEFVVLVDGLDETDTAWQVAERLRDAVCRARPIEPGADAARGHGQLRSRGRDARTTRRRSCCSAPTPRCTAPRRWAAARWSCSKTAPT